MKLALAGLPQSGKSTLFRILTGASAETASRGEPRLGVARVPDDRLEPLARVVSPKKTTPASFDVIDPPGQLFLRGGRAPDEKADPLEPLRGADAILLVLRAFINDTVAHPEGSVDPERDRRRIEEELVLGDLVRVETRLERIEKLERVGKKAETARERPLLEKLRSTLDAGAPLRGLALDEDEEKRARGYGFLSRPPLLALYNCSEGVSPALPEAGPRFASVSLPARAELEVRDLPVEDRAGFRDLYGIPEDGHDLLMRAAQELLGLLSFFTAGPPEVRAWHVDRGAPAVEAAGKIHTDIGRGFIRAEVVPWDRLVEAGSWSAARERAWLRTEGRDYVVQDGDVLHVLFKN